MTDREKLLVALLSKGGDERNGPATTVEVVSMLEQLGTEHRGGHIGEPAPVSG